MEKIVEFFKKKYVFAAFYFAFISIFFIIVMLDALVLEKGEIEACVPESNVDISNLNPVITDASYKDENIEVNLTKDRKYDSNIYVADIKIKDISYLKSIFAKNKYGKNITLPASEIIAERKTILAFNGDYYGFRDKGFVIRNGITYRDTARKKDKDDALFIYDDGSMNIVNERNTTLKNEIIKAEKENKKIVHAFTFGPGLILNGQAIESNDPEEFIKNPRTAIGIYEPLHYVVVVCDGRREYSPGLQINEMVEYMQELGCTTAYNLDGGSSSTLIFNGKLINEPSSGAERPVSDLIYVGY